MFFGASRWPPQSVVRYVASVDWLLMSQNFRMIVRGFAMATAIYAAVFGYWIYGNQPEMNTGAMYLWIRLYYGSWAIGLLAVLVLAATFVTQLLPRRPAT